VINLVILGIISRYATKTSKEIMKKLWRIWAKALGEKVGTTDTESDRIACIRTGIVLCYVITNLFIIAGVIKHWN